MPVSVKKIAPLPASGPGPKARVKNSAQISMSTERRKSKKRLSTWLSDAARRDVARGEEGEREGDERAEQRADKGHDDGLQQFRPDVAVLPLRVVPDVVARRAPGWTCRASVRVPEQISETTSPADLPKKGELRVEDEIRPAEEALADLHAVDGDAHFAGKADIWRRSRRHARSIQPGTGPDDHRLAAGQTPPAPSAPLAMTSPRSCRR